MLSLTDFDLFSPGNTLLGNFSDHFWLKNGAKAVAKMLMMFLCAKHLYVILHEPPSKCEAPSCTCSLSPTYCSKTSPGSADQLSVTPAQESSFLQGKPRHKD